MKRKIALNYKILVIIAILLCLIIGKILYVALSPTIDGINLKEFATNRNTKTKTLYASRGTIYDKDGNALALSVNSYTLIAYLSKSRTTNEDNPQHVVDKEYTAKMLATVLDIDEQTILGYLNKTAYQVEFGSKAKNLTERQKKAIEALELPGIDFIESTQRYYKMGNFASYIVGYAKKQDSGEIVGELGVEGYFNGALSGENGSTTYQADAYGYSFPSLPSVTTEAEDGSDIYLTIDSNIQLILENAVKDFTDTYSMDFAIAAVMDTETGAIVGSATSPSYNPNDLNTLSSYLNPLISYEYEPGSTMKTFSWAAALEEGIYDGDATYLSGNVVLSDDTVISDWNKKGWGYITYDTGYVNSSNVAATYLAQKLGYKKLYKYYDKFGFGKTTGIELSNELAGKIDFKYESELSNAAFGQGISVTAIQMLQAYCAIANDGIMLKPHIISKIVSKTGEVTYSFEREESERVMSEETAIKLQQLLWKANNDGQTKIWQPKNTVLSAKTGTAQISSPYGGYLDGTYDVIYSLAGLFPSDNPKYVIYTASKRIIGPQKAVANFTTKIVDEISSYSNLSTQILESETSTSYVVENYVSKKTEDVRSSLQDNLNIVVIGDGQYIVNTYPKAGTKVLKGSKIFLVTNYSKLTMPSLYGWSLSDVKTFAKLTGLNLEYSGYGYVKEQSIPEGSEISLNVLNVLLE